MENLSKNRSSNMTVMKFGGSSVANGKRMESVAKIVKESYNLKPCVILSAVGNTTDELINITHEVLNNKSLDAATNLFEKHKQLATELGVIDLLSSTFETFFNEIKNILNGVILLQEISKRTSDLITSYGERFSVRIFAAFLNSIGLKAVAYDSWEIGLYTSSGSCSEFSLRADVDVLPETYTNIKKHLGSLNKDYTHIPVITGFIAKDTYGKIVNLGRSGSDYTASIVGAAIEANEIQIWSDVNGVLSCDPRIVPDARCIDHLSYDEAAELAYFGAKVIHPMTIQPAVNAAISIRIKNSYNHNHSGTLVSQRKDYEVNKLITALTYKKDVTVIDIQSTRMLGASGFLAKVFNIFGILEISVDVIATSEVSISLTIEKYIAEEKFHRLKKQLDAIAIVTIHPNKAIISVIGNNKRSNEIIGVACCVLKRLGVSLQMVSYGASKHNINFVISDEQSEFVLRKLHEAYFSEESLSF